MSITKRTYLLTSLGDAAKVIREAFQTALSGRPGPVLIDIPKDVQAGSVSLPNDWQQHFQKPERNIPECPQSDELKQANKLIRAAKRPVILAGHGITMSGAEEVFKNFVLAEQLPVVTTIFGKGLLPPEHPLCMSWLGMHGMKYANLAIQQSDLIFAVGVRFDDRITGRLKGFAPHAKIVHLDIDASENSKIRYADVFLHGDIKDVLPRIEKCYTNDCEPARQEWLAVLSTLKEQYPIQQADRSYFSQVAALTVLNEQMDKGAYVTTDVGQHQMWASQYLHTEPGHLITSGGLGTMGFGLPAAMGVQAAHSGKEVWCVAGDGSFMMNMQELMTCVQEGYKINILLLDNAYLGMVRQWQEQFYNNNLSGVQMQNPDFVMIAKAFGMNSCKAETADELSQAISQAQFTEGPFLIHAKVIKEERVMPMVPPGLTLSETLYYTDIKEKRDTVRV